MRELEKPMGDIDVQMEGLNREMKVLSDQMNEASNRAQSQMAALIERAVSMGSRDTRPVTPAGPRDGGGRWRYRISNGATGTTEETEKNSFLFRSLFFRWLRCSVFEIRVPRIPPR